MSDSSAAAGKDFIRQIIAGDNASGEHGGRVVTRFPPEPNGFLHIGHAKSICLNFTIAEENGGQCYLRFDDTNPLKEDQAYVDAIIEDVRWLGFDWGDRLTHAADYFESFHDCAVRMIQRGTAYVDSLNADEIRELRGTLTEPGRESPYRDRPPAESLELFRRMRAGEFADGAHVLRAKIDMSADNLNMRDPVLYRIRRMPHQRAGDVWCIYPMYDFAHPISDAIEGITHSLCTLEFEDHRPLYDWIIEQFDPPQRPRQIEFSRLNLAFTLTSKRKLGLLIEKGAVTGWDDPRMPTIAGMRRRGYPPAALRDFCRRVGVTKKEKLIEMGLLESCVRDELNECAPRAMAVLDPLKVVLVNYPEDKAEMLPADNHPNRPELGQRELPFSREIYIERDDFMEDPPKKFFRLKPGGEVRLRYAYIIKCVDVIRDERGKITELHCTLDPKTRSGSRAPGRKVKGTIHWVAGETAKTVPVRLYDRLFSVARPDAGAEGDVFIERLNPESLVERPDCLIEPSLAELPPGGIVQFERLGYFAADAVESRPGRPVFNRVVTLRDSWAKIEKAEIAAGGTGA